MSFPPKSKNDSCQCNAMRLGPKTSVAEGIVVLRKELCGAGSAKEDWGFDSVERSPDKAWIWLMLDMCDFYLHYTAISWKPMCVCVFVHVCPTLFLRVFTQEALGHCCLRDTHNVCIFLIQQGDRALWCYSLHRRLSNTVLGLFTIQFINKGLTAATGEC